MLARAMNAAVGEGRLIRRSAAMVYTGCQFKSDLLEISRRI
jgi:hypothetical protein